LSDETIWCFYVDDANYLFVGTNGGVYRSNLPINSILSDNNNEISKFDLLQNYPNPFNSYTHISFNNFKLQNISLEIFDVNGKKIIAVLNKRLSPGYYNIIWDGKNSKGIKLSSGVYFYILKSSYSYKIRKMIILQ